MQSLYLVMFPFLCWLMPAFFAPLYAQDDSFVLKSFYGQELNGGVKLTWVLQGGNQCNGTRMLRSSDGIEWHEAGMIGGICGLSGADELYEWTDTLPLLNQRNYYRAELIGLGFSQVIYVDVFDTGEHGFVVLQPAPGLISIYVDERVGAPFKLEVYSPGGRLHYRGAHSTTEAHIVLSGISNGVFIITVSNQTPGGFYRRKVWLN
jgi:hypothetical protein